MADLSRDPWALGRVELLGPGGHWDVFYRADQVDTARAASEVAHQHALNAEYLRGVEVGTEVQAVAHDAAIERLQAQVYEPNIWICETCNFTLVRNFLRASDGAIGIDRTTIEDICPNDGTSMRRQTFQESSDQAAKSAVQWADRAIAAEAEVVRLTAEQGRGQKVDVGIDGGAVRTLPDVLDAWADRLHQAQGMADITPIAEDIENVAGTLWLREQVISIAEVEHMRSELSRLRVDLAQATQDKNDALTRADANYDATLALTARAEQADASLLALQRALRQKIRDWRNKAKINHAAKFGPADLQLSASTWGVCRDECADELAALLAAKPTQNETP